MSTVSDELLEIYAQRLRVQGPGHIRTIGTLWNLVQARRKESADAGESDRAAFPAPIDLPEEIDTDSIRLDGDHAEKLAGLLTLTVDLQELETSRHGPDDPRALLATCFLAHALALADQFDGQLETAVPLAEESWEGLLELADRGPGTLGPKDLEVAEALRRWILSRLEEDR
ncbi:hypothetical protein ACIBI3_20860 [Actinomadura luteofluorescens]|uniref:hypothetical protein n=1 Tax=Actinomadura luteofluorescens TaxID=46163 RepID=UPI003491F32D